MCLLFIKNCIIFIFYNGSPSGRQIFVSTFKDIWHFSRKNIWKLILQRICFWMLWNDLVIETNKNISALNLLSSQEVRNLTLLLLIIIFYFLGFVRVVFNCIIMLQTNTVSAYKCRTLSMKCFVYSINCWQQTTVAIVLPCSRST